MTPFSMCRPRRLPAGALGFAGAVLGLLVFALPVVAAPTAHHPKGLFAPFAYCPFNDPELDLCQAALTTGGELRIGEMVVPITRTFVSIRGAWNGEPNTLPAEPTFSPPEEASTLQSMPLPIPGGLASVIEPASLPSSLRAVAEDLVGAGLGGLTATMELAGPTSSVKPSFKKTQTGEGVTLEEPLKIKLTNPFLGENCHLGSLSDPIKIVGQEELTSPPPPNKPIKGVPGHLTLNESEGLFEIRGNSTVDDSFAVPAASGCGGSLAPLIDRAIDAKLGLPSPPGRNAEVINGTLEVTLPASVLASE